jgi:mannan endo-1,4-beta-mannosidase
MTGISGGRKAMRNLLGLLVGLGFCASLLSGGENEAVAKSRAARKPAKESATKNLSTKDFVIRSGHDFTLNGKLFRVAGVNNHYLTYGSRVEVTRVLDDAVAMNANVVRIFVSPVIGSTDGAVANVFNFYSTADSSNLGVNGVYMASFDPVKKEMQINRGANGLERLDFVIGEASKRGLRVIVAFLDYWGYTGGARQISAWYGDHLNDHFFAEDERARADYKRLVREIVLRRNRLTGVVYRDDPTIFAWELMNEPDIHPFVLFYMWTAEMAAYVKTLDSRHLLSSGQASIDYKMAELRLPQVDFGTWHGYSGYQKYTPDQFSKEISQYCGYAASYGKPVVLEEFGVARSEPQRPEIYRNWLAQIAGDDRCSGWLVWRLVSRQDSNQYPLDDHDQFDIHNDGSPVWLALRESARLMNATPTRRISKRHDEEKELP